MSEPAAAPPAGRGERLLPLLPVVLLLVVVAIHQFNVRANDLAPDIGGGFGMFAFVDNSGWRSAHVTIEDTDGRTWVVDLERQGRDLDLSGREVQRILAMPSARTLEDAAALVKDATWLVDDSGTLSTRHVGGEPVTIANVRIRVLGIEYDGERDEVRRTTLATWPARP